VSTGTLRVEYQGRLSAHLLDYLGEAARLDPTLRVVGTRPLTVHSADVDQALLRILPFLGDPAMGVGAVTMRRAGTTRPAGREA